MNRTPTRPASPSSPPLSPMRTPAFYEQVAPVVLHDALAQTLGATLDGLIEYRYLDAVKLAGHSCPTVAGAWLMTRAAGPGGFKGLAGRHARRELLHFGAALRGELRFTRLDSGHSVELSLRLDALARPADLRALMQAALTPDADAATRERFAAAWQDWVRTLLVEHGDDPRLIEWQH